MFNNDVYEKTTLMDSSIEFMDYLYLIEMVPNSLIEKLIPLKPASVMSFWTLSQNKDLLILRNSLNYTPKFFLFPVELI